MFQWPITVSIDNFLLEVDYCFHQIKKFVFYNGVGILLDQTGRNVVSIEIRQNFNSSFSKSTVLISSINVWLDRPIPLEIRWQLLSIFLYVVAFVEILIGQQCDNVQFTFLFLSNFELEILLNYWLKIFGQSLRSCFLFKSGLLCESDFCMFDQTLIRPIDGKYRRAAEPLVILKANGLFQDFFQCLACPHERNIIRNLHIPKKLVFISIFARNFITSEVFNR